MRNLVMLVFFAAMLSGCNTFGIIFSSKVDPTDAKGEWNAVVPLSPMSFREGEHGSSSVWKKLLDGKSEQYTSLCKGTAAGVEGFGPALAAVGGAAWDIAVDAINSKVDEIKSKSMKTWSATWSISVESLKTTECLALVRYKKDDAGLVNPQMVILLHLKKFEGGKAFQIVPLFVLSKTSIAMTKDEGGGRGEIGLSIAAAQVALTGDELKESTAEAVTVGGIFVKEKGENEAGYASNVGMSSPDSSMQGSKPMTYPKSTDVYLKFAVTETGSLSGDDAKSKAELKAVTDALGPIAKEALKKRFAPDDSK
ncbi:hypothetical protein [Pseudomonas sp. URMO17WK12:I11]|uniref:hypothetical protein n=1 Tax=Pseudomonas sp. URMO17WK12:I11 TaxID=1283291 RepID=UPI00071FBFBD|nr:hypothetical protein [Pseudomonas sp. URMO17WK12:I11]CRL52385.1 hypothetical protein PSHI_55960 [Pseudomonas sp. URMO17WK12:I11]